MYWVSERLAYQLNANKNRQMTEAEVGKLQSKSVEDHGLSNWQVRSFVDPVNKNNEVRKEVRNIAGALETNEEIDNFEKE